MAIHSGGIWFDEGAYRQQIFSLQFPELLTCVLSGFLEPTAVRACNSAALSSVCLFSEPEDSKILRCKDHALFIHISSMDHSLWYPEQTYSML
jgi:hypothetical protein